MYNVNECSVCKTSRQDAFLYHFPCTEKRLAKWLKCINRENLKRLTPKQLSKLFVCQKHFERRFITSGSRLLAKAYPSLFTKDEISSGIPSQENTENYDPQIDHNYARLQHFDHTYAKTEIWHKDTISASSSMSQELLTTSQHPIIPCLPSTSQDSVTITSGSSTSQDLLKTSLHSVPCLPSTSQNTGLNVKNIVKPKHCRKRLIGKLKDLTPTCQILYKEYRKARQQKNFYQRAQKALRFNKENYFEKLTKGLNPYAKKILLMQINLCTKHKKGRRFTLEEKMIALSIMKQSPKCYRFLHKIFILPSRSTLNKLVSNLNIEPGICPQIFQLLKKEVCKSIINHCLPDSNQPFFHLLNLSS